MGNNFTKRLILTSLAFVAGLSFAWSQYTGSWLSGGDAFLKGNWVEVGIGNCGAYGTPTAPPTPAGGPANAFHPNAAMVGLGFVADHQKDGWASGSPAYCGDYFVPGSPVEGFSMQVNGITYMNTDGAFCSFPSIPTTSLNVFSTVDSVRAVWVGTVGGMFTVTQTTRYHKDSLFFVTDVVICNISGAPLNNVYYGRNVDPDNEQPWSADFTTTNTIVSQPIGASTDALVTATGLVYGCYLGLGSKDTRARVTHGGFSTVDPTNYYNGTPGYLQSGTTTSDEAISIGFSLGNIAVGQCVCLSFAYILNSAQMGSALNATTGVGVMAGGVDISSSLTAPICPPATSVPIDILGGGSYTWTWSPAAGLSTTTGPSVIASPATTTTYTATGIRPGNCGLVTRTITVLRDNSTLDAGPPQTMCAPDSILMNATYSGFPLGGITCTPDYIVASKPFAMEPPGVATNITATFGAFDDNLYGPFVIPFTFNFFCIDYTNIYVSSNGFASFSSMAGSGCCSGQVLPTTWEPNAVIAAGWEDLYPPGGGNISYWTTGVAPNRHFVIRWTGVPHYSGFSPYFDTYMEVVLIETSNVVEINLQSMPSDGGTHTCGIENEAGTVGFWPSTPTSHNATSWSATNESWRFTPNPIISGGYTWSPSSVMSSGLIEDPMAWPSSTTMFHVSVNNGYCTFTDSVLVTVSCILPADMLTLSGSKAGATSNLDWLVSSSLLAQDFYIERSSDGKTYQQIGKVGAINMKDAYNFRDLLPNVNENYYRIRVIDVFGEENFSNVVLVHFSPDEINTLRNVYPNPSTGLFNFDISVVEKADISISVYNHLGQRVKADSWSYDQAGRFTNLLDMSEMSNGVYFYEMSIGDRQYQGKLSVLR